jgi:hypothetical protein
VTTLVLKLRALGLFTLRHLNVTVFRGFFLHRLIKDPEIFHVVFPDVSYTLSLRFVIVTTLVLELRALGLFTIGRMNVSFPGFFLHRLM